MKVTANHPDTGESVEVEIPGLTEDKLRDLLKENASDSRIDAALEKLQVSAEIKLILSKLAKFSIKVGNQIVKIGKKVMEIAIYISSNFKHVTLAVVISAVLAFLISSIPLLGPVLGPFFTPLILALGLVKGLWEELKNTDPKLSMAVKESGEIFSSLKGSAA